MYLALGCRDIFSIFILMAKCTEFASEKVSCLINNFKRCFKRPVATVHEFSKQTFCGLFADEEKK
jgi:hypothetical protein